jgi:pectate lyase-like protein
VTFAAILADVYRRTGFASSPPTDVVTRLKAFVNETQQEILGEPGMECLLNDSVTFASVADQQTYGLPVEITKIKTLREATNRIVLLPMSLGEYRQRYPDPSAVTGTPTRWVDLGFDAVNVEPSDASTLYVVSSSGADTNTAYIEGYLSSGAPFSVSVVMTGATAVAFSPATVTNVTKFYLSAAAAGTVTLREDSGSGTVLSTIYASQTLARYRRIALAPTPSAAITYTVEGERLVTDMVNDTDEPVLPAQFHRLLSAGARAKEKEKTSRGQDWQIAQSEYDKGLRKLKFWVYEQSVGTPNLRGTNLSRPSIMDGGTTAATGGSSTPVTVPNGGTGFSSYAIGDLLYADTAASLARLNDVAIGSVLSSGGVGVAPRWTSSGVINVKDYGAVGDGTTDDSTAIQNAITAWLATTNKPTLFFPAGRYLCGTNLTVTFTTAQSRAQMRILGYGADLKLTAASGWGLTIGRSGNVNVRYFALEGLTLRGNSTSDTLTGLLKMDGGTNGTGYFHRWVMRDVAFEEFMGTGCQLFGNAFEAQLYSCAAQAETTNITAPCFDVLNGASGIVSSVDFYGCTTDRGLNGIQSNTPGNGIKIYGGTFIQAAEEGVTIESALEAVVIGAHFENNWQQGVASPGWATTQAGLKIAGQQCMVYGCHGTNTASNQRYVVRAYASPTAAIYGGSCPGGSDTTDYYARLEGAANCCATLIGVSGGVSGRYHNGLPGSGQLTVLGGELTTTAIVPSLTASNLTSGRVPIAGSAGLLADDADLTFSGDTLTVTKASIGTILNKTVAGICQGRLTLTSGTPVTTADVTGATSVYFTPYTGNGIGLYDGSSLWTLLTFTEATLALGTLTSGLPYDVFAYNNSGTIALEALAWSSGTTRATALTLQDGILVKTGATTRRYLGTFYTTSTTQTEDSFAKRFLWNYYNRVARPMRVVDATNTWQWTTNSYQQANAAATNQLDFVVGVAEVEVEATVIGFAANATVPQRVEVSIGVDSASTAASGVIGQFASLAIAGEPQIVTASLKAYSAIGRHFWAWLERDSTATGTTTWLGDNGDNTLVQAGIHGSLMG